MKNYHNPVMLKEAIEGLNIKPNGVYVDATFGGGGHSMAILQKEKGIRLFSFDQDEDAVEIAEDLQSQYNGLPSLKITSETLEQNFH